MEKPLHDRLIEAAKEHDRVLDRVGYFEKAWKKASDRVCELEAENAKLREALIECGELLAGAAHPRDVLGLIDSTLRIQFGGK